MSNESIYLNGVVESVSSTDILTLTREILVLCVICQWASILVSIDSWSVMLGAWSRKTPNKRLSSIEVVLKVEIIFLVLGLDRLVGPRTSLFNWPPSGLPTRALRLRCRGSALPEFAIDRDKDEF